MIRKQVKTAEAINCNPPPSIPPTRGGKEKKKFLPHAGGRKGEGELTYIKIKLNAVASSTAGYCQEIGLRQ